MVFFYSQILKEADLQKTCGYRYQSYRKLNVIHSGLAILGPLAIRPHPRLGISTDRPHRQLGIATDRRQHRP